MTAAAPQMSGQSTYTPYAFTNFVGTPGGPGSVDGAGSAARFKLPYAVAVGSTGNVYVADTGNYTIRKITPSGVVSTLAGSPGKYGHVDDIGSLARFSGPSSIAVDNAEVVYVADMWNVRKITPNGVVSTLGINGLSRPVAVTVDNAANLYVADGDSNTVQKITANGATSVVGVLDIGLNSPTGIAVDDDGAVYVVNFWQSLIVKMASTGVVTRTLNGLRPASVALDRMGNLFLADAFQHTIARLALTNWNITSLAGSAGQVGDADGFGIEARFGAGGVGPTANTGPLGVAADQAGNVYVADTYNHTIRKVRTACQVTTFAGSAGYGSADGSGTEARFYWPYSVAIDSTGGLYVADYRNFTVRKVAQTGEVTTLAGVAGQFGTNDGIGNIARFGGLFITPGGEFSLGPSGVAVDSVGWIYVLDPGNCSLRSITSTGTVSTMEIGEFCQAFGVAADAAGNVYVADSENNVIRQITKTGTVKIFAGSIGESGSADGNANDARFAYPQGVAVDNQGQVYIADSGNCTIRKIAADGIVTTVAGTAGQWGSADGTGKSARFDTPAGIAVDIAGNLFIADTGNQTIRKITPGGVVTTLAGSVSISGGQDGIGDHALFNSPSAIAVDASGNLFVADTMNNRITKGIPLLQFEPPNRDLEMSNGVFTLPLTGPVGRTVIVESSGDLRTWIPLQTNVLPPTGVEMRLSVTPDTNQFIRAHLAP